jgi:hypothetical protein
MAQQKYSIKPRSNDRYDVVVQGPYVVAADLKWIEAEALARALNEENKDR